MSIENKTTVPEVDSDGLFACPFCGRLDMLHTDRDGDSWEGNIYFVRCIPCDVRMMGKTEHDAITKWNLRANSPDQPLETNSTGEGDRSASHCSPLSADHPPNDSEWARIEFEELRNGILQAYMRSAEHNDRVLYVCMKAHHMAANKAIVELGGETTELPVLDHFLENAESIHPEPKP